MFTEITNIVTALDTNSIAPQRKEILQALIHYIQEKRNANDSVILNFICTHNSRRSHLCQVWAQTMAHHFNIPKVFSYSGGTETTSMFPTVVSTFKNQGFQIHCLAENNNPIYAIKYKVDAHPIIGFSKTFDHYFNPKSGFAAVMTCSSADEGCPYVAGAQIRIPITFEDPKVFDNTPLQAKKYEERSLEIATELKYVFSKIG